MDDAGRQLRANSEVRGGGVTLEVPPPEVPYHLEPDPSIELSVVYEDDDLLIVDKPAGLVVHPAPGHWQGTLVNALLGARRPLRRHRGRRATRHRPSPRSRHVRPDHGRAQRRRAGVADGPAQGPPRAQDVSRARPGQRRRGRRADRGADRARPEGPQADGRRQRRPARRHGLPRPRAVRRAGRSSSSTSSPVARTRSASTSRRSAIRSRATRSTGPARRAGVRTASSACSCTPGGSSSSRRRPPSSSAPRRRCRPTLEAVLDGLRAGEASAGRRPQGGAS